MAGETAFGGPNKAHLHRRPPARNVKGLLSEVSLQSNDSYKSRNTLTGGLSFDSTAS